MSMMRTSGSIKDNSPISSSRLDSATKRRKYLNMINEIDLVYKIRIPKE